MLQNNVLLKSGAQQKRPHQLKKGNSRDELSGLLNIRTARKHIAAHLKTMEPDAVCAMLLIDIDNFKQINDRLGRLTGDHIIKRVGHMLSALFRASDIVSRLGKDEFIVFISGRSTEESVYEAAKSICRAIKFTEGSDPQMEISVCVGAFIITEADMTFEKIYVGCFEALSEARRNGYGNFYITAGEIGQEVLGKDRKVDPVKTLRLPMLLEHMDGGVGLLEVGEQIKLIYASRGFYEIAGAEKDAYTFPLSIREIGIHPDYEADYEQEIRNKAKNGGIVDHIQKICGKGKDWKWRRVRTVRIGCPGSEHPIMLEISADISSMVESQQRLKESNEIFKLLFENSSHVLWEVDIKEGIFHAFDVNSMSFNQEHASSKFPDVFFNDKMVHPDSEKNFRAFAADILSGKSEGKGNFIMWNPAQECYGWFLLSYRMVYDRDGNPVKAIGFTGDFPETEWMIGSQGFSRRPLPEALRHHLVGRIHVNLTTDTVEEVWQEGIGQIASIKGKCYSEIVQGEFLRLFVKAEEIELEERFKRENLLKSFGDGEYWLSMEYRRIDNGGNIRWMAEVINLIRNQETQDICMFASLSDVQQRHNWENLLSDGVKRDRVTGLYDSETIRALAEKIIGERAEMNCALALIQVKRGGETLKKDDTADRERKMHFIASALSFSIGTDCISGRYNDDTMLIFIPNAGSKEDIRKRLKQAFTYTRTSTTDIFGINNLFYLACVISSRTGETEYETMLFNADRLREIWKNAAKDTVVFSEEKWGDIQEDGKDGEVIVLPKEDERPLSEEEQKAAFACVAAMLQAESVEDSMEKALECIGKYYKADRVYILKLLDNSSAVDMEYEWTEKTKESIRRIVKGIGLNRMPLLRKSMKEEKPIFIKRKTGMMGKELGKEEWRFAVVPLKLEGSISGFLCIENFQEHWRNTALLNKVVPYMSQEQKRFGQWRDQAEQLTSGNRNLDQVPNLHAYMETVHSLDSDSHSSMGALALDVPNFSDINSIFGFEYGRRMLQDILDTLADSFGNALIFRTWDQEFVILYPNTTLDVFIKRSVCLRTVLQRRYPKQLRIGYTWSEGMFFARNLVREARSIMLCEGVKKEYGARTEFLDMDEKETDAEEKKNFIPYFQPKIDMSSGKLAGAEALVRGIDGEGNIITPNQFIEALEKNGSIRELDLYMLESVLEHLSQWKAKGLPDIKVSVNISRFTLLNPTTLASILAIQSHYPDIPTDQIDFEITETAGDIEKATLSVIVDNFREFGIRFQLDDFGSHYANMSIFSNIKFNTIKLDRSLINEIPDNKISYMLVEDIVRICKEFNMDCIAEGVETRHQEEALLKAGCIYGQGYYYSRPLSPENFENQYLRQVN